MRADTGIVICKICGKPILTHLLGKHLKQEHDIDYLNLKYEKKEVKETPKKIEKKVAKSVFSDEQKAALAEQVAEVIVEKAKRKRGRPRKSEAPELSKEQIDKLLDFSEENSEQKKADEIVEKSGKQLAEDEVDALLKGMEKMQSSALGHPVSRDPTLKSAEAIETMKRGKTKNE